MTYRARLMMGFALSLLLPGITMAQQAASSGEANAECERGDIFIGKLIAVLKTRLNKKFIIDPRVRACVDLTGGLDPQTMSYRDFQAVLALYGFVDTPEVAGIITIMPDANARQMPLRLIDDKTRDVGEFEMVIKLIDPSPLSSANLVPILRPLLSQYSHLVSQGETNTLIVVGRYSNVRSLENLIREMRKAPVVAPYTPDPPRSSATPAK
jgi:type II secretory pathway component GspD/PulD (secretin)